MKRSKVRKLPSTPQSDEFDSASWVLSTSLNADHSGQPPVNQARGFYMRMANLLFSAIIGAAVCIGCVRNGDDDPKKAESLESTEDLMRRTRQALDTELDNADLTYPFGAQSSADLGIEALLSGGNNVEDEAEASTNSDVQPEK